MRSANRSTGTTPFDTPAPTSANPLASVNATSSNGRATGLAHVVPDTDTVLNCGRRVDAASKMSR
jgi:hypothetical protein